MRKERCQTSPTESINITTSWHPCQQIHFKIPEANKTHRLCEWKSYQRSSTQSLHFTDEKNHRAVKCSPRGDTDLELWSSHSMVLLSQSLWVVHPSLWFIFQVESKQHLLFENEFHWARQTYIKWTLRTDGQWEKVRVCDIKSE